jgi:hypothetical protein
VTTNESESICKSYSATSAIDTPLAARGFGYKPAIPHHQQIVDPKRPVALIALLTVVPVALTAGQRAHRPHPGQEPLPTHRLRAAVAIFYTKPHDRVLSSGRTKRSWTQTGTKLCAWVQSSLLSCDLRVHNPCHQLSS